MEIVNNVVLSLASLGLGISGSLIASYIFYKHILKLKRKDKDIIKDKNMIFNFRVYIAVAIFLLIGIFGYPTIKFLKGKVDTLMLLSENVENAQKLLDAAKQKKKDDPEIEGD